MPRDSFLERAWALPFARATTTDVPSPFANRLALLALVPLLVLVALIAIWAPWYSHYDIDAFTHYLQILSIADHGSGGYSNGLVAGNPELTPRWLFPAHGQAWGQYPILGDYVLALAARLGGFRGIIRAIWLFFGESCLVTYALTYRLTRRPAIAVAAAYSLVLASPVGFWGTMIAPFIPAAACGVTSLYFVARSFMATTRARGLGVAALGGVLASFAVGYHLLWTLAWVFVPIVWISTPGLTWRLERAASYVMGSAPGLLLMGWVNHGRFGTWSPFSYGPCEVDGCLESTVEANAQNGRAFFATSLPLVPYVLAALAGLWLVRRSRARLATLTVVAVLAALVPNTAGGTLFRNVARTFWAYVFDVGSLDVGYLKWAEGPGTFSFLWRYGGPFCLRALLQCSPVLIAVALPQAPRGPAERATRRVLVAACVGVLASILARSNLPSVHTIGIAFLNQRYLVPALPALTVLAFVALAELPLRAWHVALAVIVGASGAAVLAAEPSDSDLLRREVTHWLPLGLAFGLWLSASAARVLARSSRRLLASRVAALIAAVAVGYGGAITWGIDRVASRAVRGYQDGCAEELARCTPHRFILVGGRAMIEGLSVLDRKQVYFMNPLMGPRDGSNVRRLVLEALSPAYPAFLMDDDALGNRWHFDWPGLAFEEIEGCPRIRRIVAVDAP